MRQVSKMLSIHVTDKCNNRCVFCVVDAPSQTKEQVSRKLIDAFLTDHQNQDYVAVNLHGGEPTTRKDFLEILQKINACGYPKIILQTNARRLANEKFAREVYEHGVKLFVISVHGKDGDTQDMITKIPGSFEQTLQGIKNVKQLGAKVRTNTVVSRLNYPQLPDIMNLLLSLNIDHINISALHTAGTAYKYFEKVTPTYTEIFPFVKQAVEDVVKQGTHLTLEGFPYCMIPGLEQHMLDWSTEQFKMLYQTRIFEDYEKMMDRECRKRGNPCVKCDKKDVCGGVYKEYIEQRGWDEFGYHAEF